MKYFAIFSALVLLVTLVFVGSLYITSNIYIEAAGVTIVPASEHPALFASLSDQLRLDALAGTAFTTHKELGDAEDYQFCVYTVRLKNDCRIPAELAEVQIGPRTDDVLQISQSDYLSDPENGFPAVPTLTGAAPGGTGEVAGVLLTKRGNHTIREVTVTCYLWGVPFTLKTTVE